MRDSILRWLTGSYGVHAETLMVVVRSIQTMPQMPPPSADV